MIAAVVFAAGAVALLLIEGSSEHPIVGQSGVSDDPVVASAVVLMPSQLSPAAETGRVAFADNCAVCHGENGEGSNQGPPLIHTIYEPSHHADIAFVLAAQNGSRAHHWNFGNMPPQPQVSEQEIAAIIQFVREVQRANGIF